MFHNVIPIQQWLSGTDIAARGVLASVARLGYLVRVASRQNQTVIFMALLMLQYVPHKIHESRKGWTLIELS